MRKTLCLFLAAVALKANAQWVDKQRMADSLQNIAKSFINKSKLYEDSANAEADIFKRLRYNTTVIRLVDSAEKYIVWSEEEMVYDAKEQIQIEGFRLALKRIALQKVDSSDYNKMQALYQELREEWIKNLKNLYKH